MLCGTPLGAVSAQGEVLDLAEAAQLLRLPTATVEQMARAGRLPGRDIDGQWRFSRRALMDWLATTGPVASPLPADDLARTTGRQQPAGSGAAPIGEQKAAPSAEAIALRSQGGLLRKGTGTVELGLAYGRSEDSLYPVLRNETTTTVASGVVRFVPVDGVQFAARLPYVWQRSDRFIDTASLPGPAQVTTRSEGRGDASLAVLGELVRERGGVPNLLVSLDGTIAADSSRSSGLGGSIVVSKSADPAVLFAGVSYLHALQSERVDERSGIARSNFAFNLGLTYALNDLVALSTTFDGVYRDYRAEASGALAGSLPPSRQVYTLQFGATWLLARGLFIEPAVAIRVGGERPDMLFTLNLPWTF
jgi:excisionase family DNA binding protein